MTTYIDIIKARFSIFDAIQQFSNIELKKSHFHKKSFTVNCPFHNDRSPSFTIYPKTNTFFCWSGCNDRKAGDVINFVALAKGVSVQEAIQVLISYLNLRNIPKAQLLEQLSRKRMEQQKTLVLREQVLTCTRFLFDLEKRVQRKLLHFKNIDEVEEHWALYHFYTKIDYWLYHLEHSDYAVQQDIIQTIDAFMRKESSYVE